MIYYVQFPSFFYLCIYFCLDNDTLVFIDFRADRMRQIVEALGVQPQFEASVTPGNLSVYTMTEYKETFSFPVLFPVTVPPNTLAEWLSLKDLYQFHCAGGWSHE